MSADSEALDRPLTSKERRLLRRSAARQATECSEQDDKAVPDVTSPASLAVEGTTAKERRLARRTAEREAAAGVKPASVSTETAAALVESEAEAARRRTDPLIVFVGQLSFKTTAAQIVQHFRTKGGIEGPMRIRLLTHEGSQRSKGMAFVELCDPETLYKCLALHHTNLGGRILNVERTAGGRKTARKTKVDSLRAEQKETMKQAVTRIMGDMIAKGVLGPDELDQDAVRVLEKFEGKVVEKALLDYCAKPDKATLRNKSAYFVHITHAIAFDESLDIDKEIVTARKALEDAQSSNIKGTTQKAGAKRKRPDSTDAGSGKQRKRSDSQENANEGQSQAPDASLFSNVKSIGGHVQSRAAGDQSTGTNAKQRRNLKRAHLNTGVPSEARQPAEISHEDIHAPNESKRSKTETHNTPQNDTDHSQSTDKAAVSAGITDAAIAGMTAKERRLARRAADRAAAEPKQ